MAVVHCRHANGVVLQLHEVVEGPLGGKEMRRVGPSMELRPGRNEVDDSFWKAWSDQNKGGALGRMVEEEQQPES